MHILRHLTTTLIACLMLVLPSVNCSATELPSELSAEQTELSAEPAELSAEQPADSAAVSTESASAIQRVEQWYADHMNYTSIVALMTIESSFIPFPSEVVIPPAVYVASHDDSTLNVSSSYIVNVLLIVLFGTLGALLGAIINYLLSMWLGRPIIYAFADSRAGRVLMLSSDKIKQAETYFNEHGKVSTFIGRFIPGIRQLISIPAGLSKMNFLSFAAYTTLGAFLWNAVLALIGYLAHGQADLINRYSHELSVALLAITALAIVVVIVRKVLKKRATDTKSAES